MGCGAAESLSRVVSSRVFSSRVVSSLSRAIAESFGESLAPGSVGAAQQNRPG
eukprot:NODE_9027_length_357_cov_152.344371.p4 GENE.NODE_9027_length_357_cov_152.344371~~NODE_9027_length_357_cov_152.344371.p4  ORF type:complete len:53 (-),score=0.22 NODE_9027_length_357_cov_152.344371:181-339(-)